MPHTVGAACREELRRAGLPGQGAQARLLALLRTAPESHLRVAQVVRMAKEIGLASTPVELAGHLETLADHGLLGRLPGGAEPVFDTVPEPHSHLIYEDPAQIVDLDVSSETLLAILRHALAEWPDRVEVIIRLRAVRTARCADTPRCGRERNQNRQHDAI